ncbi:hypothetical protein SUGI_1077170 [Cryptomeria japonica]|nr:hypothetical protein SUGI_1077170 [Cryptomeria japonica]
MTQRNPSLIVFVMYKLLQLFMGKQGSANRRGRKHPSYIGVRKRKWGMRVSEIRESRKEKRIWLVSFPTLEMASRAHYLAAFSLRRDSTNFNFPHLIHSLPCLSNSSATNF